MGWVNASRGRSYVFLKINAKAALASAVLLLLAAAACDPVPSAPDLPEIELPTVARSIYAGQHSIYPSRPWQPLLPTPIPTATTACAVATLRNRGG